MHHKTILVVENDPDIVSLLAAILETHDYGAVALLGREALNYAVDQQPAAIILDMMIPLLSGPAVLSYLHEEPVTSAIPVIVVTAVPGHERTNRTLGAYATIHKPFNNKHLVATLEAALRGDPPPALEE